MVFFVMLFLCLFSSLYSMEIPLLSTETDKKLKDSDKALILKQQNKIEKLQQKISSLTSQIKENPYEININTNQGVRVLKGAGAGGCGGFLCSVCGLSTYGIVDKCVWCCWNVSTPTNIAYDMMMYGIPACTLLGCIMGTCCTIARCDEKIKIIVD